MFCTMSAAMPNTGAMKACGATPRMVRRLEPILRVLPAIAGSEPQRFQQAYVITYACWKRWGSDPAIAGKTLKIGSNLRTILGVAPQAFIAPVFGIAADIVQNIASADADAEMENRQARRYLLNARLNPGASPRQARAEVETLWRQLASQYPEAAHNR